MKSKTALKWTISSILLFSVVTGIQAVELIQANPVPWPPTPNTEEPTLVIETPQNYTTYADNSVLLNFTVKEPDSWNAVHIVIPYVGKMSSIDSYLDGTHYRSYFIGLNNFTSFSEKLKMSTSGVHLLNITALSYTFYSGPIYSNSSVAFGNSSNGIVYEYPIVVSDTIYFTTVAENSPSPSAATTALPSLNPTPTLSPTHTQSPSPSPTQQPTSSLTYSPVKAEPYDGWIPYSLISAVAVLAIVALIQFKKHRQRKKLRE
jgi:hypothetical protein